MSDTGQEQEPTHSPAYAGRWVAEIGSRIVAQAGTPEQAESAARAQRHKEKALVRYIPMTTQLPQIPYLEQIQSAFPQGVPIYIVGGAVRDMLIGRQAHDIDFILDKDALKVARAVANRLGGAYFPLDEERSIARVVVGSPGKGQIVLDFALFQGEGLDGDLGKRDFTINAIALDGRDPGKLFDPLGGVSDLRARLLRVCSANSIPDDPLRIMRGIRLAANFDLHIAPETRMLMKTHASGLARISPERKRDELFYILGGLQPAAGIQALNMLGALDYVLPEIPALMGQTQSPPHVADVYEHTLDVLRKLIRVLAVLKPGFDPHVGGLMESLVSLHLGRFRDQIGSHLESCISADRSREQLLYLSALYHDVAKPHVVDVDESGKIRFLGHENEGAAMTARRSHKLRLSSKESGYLETVVRHHMRPLWLTNTGQMPTRRAIYRFFRDTQETGVGICLLSLADTWATYGHTLTQDLWIAHLSTIRALLEAFWEQRDVSVQPVQLIDGNDLIKALGIQPGPLVGRILEAVREAQASGEIGDREATIEFAKEWLKRYSPQG